MTPDTPARLQSMQLPAVPDHLAPDGSAIAVCSRRGQPAHYHCDHATLAGRARGAACCRELGTDM